MQYSLLVFEIVFYNHCNIMGVTYKGWVSGRGWVVGKQVGKPKAGPPCHYATDSGAVFPVDDRNVHKPQDKSRQYLAAAWHTTNSD